MSKEKRLEFDTPIKYYSDNLLTVYRIHPNGMRVQKAEKTLLGTADPSGNIYCHAYKSANEFGYWLFPNINIDIACHEFPVEGSWRGRWGGNYTYNVDAYDNSDFELMKKFEDQVSNPYGIKYNGKACVTIDEPMKDTISLWTGCFFAVKKDYSLMIKSPTNLGLVYEKGCPVCVQEGILCCSWMRYDIWANFKFHTYDKMLSLRKHQDWPIAQLIPIFNNSYEQEWKLEDKVLDASDPDCVYRYQEYSEYNYKKWCASGQKDSFCFKKLKKTESKNH